MVNMFYLDDDPDLCARYYCNRHVVKIILEIAQMLCNIHHELGSCKTIPYKVFNGNKQYPYKWIKKNKGNYIWSSELGLALVKEYEYRYSGEHKTKKVLLWLRDNVPSLPDGDKTPFEMSHANDRYWTLTSDVLFNNRVMYAELKCKGDKWKNRAVPAWFNAINDMLNDRKPKLMKQMNDKIGILCDKYNMVYDDIRDIALDVLLNNKWQRVMVPSTRYRGKDWRENLSLPQLYHVNNILNDMNNVNNYDKYKSISKRHRRKLDFPIDNIDYHHKPWMYVYDIRSMINNNDDVTILLNNMTTALNDNDFITADTIRRKIQYTDMEKAIDVVKNDKFHSLMINFITRNWYDYKSNVHS